MTKLTNTLILDTAAQLVEQHGAADVTLADVGEALGTSRAALYKHFKNKQDLWTSLSLYWLDQVLAVIFPFDTSGYSSQADIAHDWLWALANAKIQTNQNDPQMFKLYTDYIDGNPEVLAIHLQDLTSSLAAALKTDDLIHVQALLQAFTYFTTPAFATDWGEHTRDQFEAIWQLIAPSFETLMK
ncbi:TetR/AcrR family transcriptional regulator [Levilactobacillus bambusae]|uniref:TetR/AcrR family transcriptional regulator n=1 Tax=Levilactobacillus bambusae TaxID=2024736 RepID=A0A2V1MZH5_9LACO|nr:TetR/AcrR family transcriptional regulator [Levilactobacillus bambusae]PWG00414.1 TetR/AcrR family transcriptional regulator [Levilactobacillus bambusae]